MGALVVGGGCTYSVGALVVGRHALTLWGTSCRGVCTYSVGALVVGMYLLCGGTSCRGVYTYSVGALVVGGEHPGCTGCQRGVTDVVRPARSTSGPTSGPVGSLVMGKTGSEEH